MTDFSASSAGFGPSVIDENATNSSYAVDAADSDSGASSSGFDSARMYPWLLLVLSLLGVVTNVASFFMFTRQRFRKDFHRLLIILACYDLLVVLFCAMMYCLPPLWPTYDTVVYPYLAPVLLPLVHIALMSSVYCTVVMSWERYVRICLISNLVSCNYFSRAKFRLYLAIITVFPVAFYITKFFEFRPHLATFETTTNVDCFNVTLLEDLASHNLSQMPPEVLECLPVVLGNLGPRPSNASAASFRANLTSVEQAVVIRPTALRENWLYYRVYCIGLNTLFATVLPSIILLYCNVSTVVALSKLGKQNEEAELSDKMRRSNSPVCRRRENRLTRISLTIVWLFLFCHMWKMIPTTWEAFVGAIEDGPAWLGDMKHVSHALIIFNSSVNFLIYIAL